MVTSHCSLLLVLKNALIRIKNNCSMAYAAVTARVLSGRFHQSGICILVFCAAISPEEKQNLLFIST